MLPLRTRDLHFSAERSGFVADLVRGRASRSAYALYLRNLVPAYAELERGLEASELPEVRWFARPELIRSQALEADLAWLAGPAWQASLPLLPAGLHYGHRIRAAALEDGPGLLGHAYVRYLGDLSGGQILRKVLARSLGLGPEALTFYDFPEIADLDDFKQSFRRALDRAGLNEALVSEAEMAFRLNIALSEAVQTASSASRCQAA